MNAAISPFFSMSLQCGNRGKGTCLGISVQCDWLWLGASGCLGMRQAAKYQVAQAAMAHVVCLALLIQQGLGTASQELSCSYVMLLSVN